MENVEILDISGDLGINVLGQTLEDIFINAAIGFYSLTTSIETVNAITTIQVKVMEDTTERLLVAWLNELIYIFDTDGFIGKKVTIESLDGRHILATLNGEYFNPEKHECGLLIKAATYHKLQLEKGAAGWSAVIIFDI
ncbi:archease [Candidatus Magnetobacterium casense]|uniref:Archease n=1 Tax=Candidatus Magnetobacterium casense TaxID=1455061 RepID=A0ABS6RVB8_9BACT|nr:archease [Candidatus Magnetobacterium casensis]MBV6340579.1 archease [Candidatus Magnetobacterium casensis]